MGESLYNDIIPDIITDLKKKKLAVTQSGNIIVILNELKNKDGYPMGVILKKSNGIYLYAATDIACIKYRYDVFKANKIIYYTDLRQSQHLSQIFMIARKAKYIPSSVQLEHHAFGMILKKDGTPFKTRSGNTIKLSTLLQQAKEKAKNLILNKKTNIAKEDIELLSQAIGIGAIKYFELSKNRTTNYVFDWNNMLNFHGNTAPYMQYAYAHTQLKTSRLQLILLTIRTLRIGLNFLGIPLVNKM
uniref:Arginyl-tRNA synthetase catalytic core domain-containing protein n=1 Tax=Glossina pallidipes TaxID=7398 RepID=A0A1A9Z0W3_GLOPL